MMERFLAIGLLLLSSLAPAWAADGPQPDGAKLFARNCAACHGEEGRGGIGVPLALPSFQATISDDYVFKTIRHGRPGRVMPAFPNLSDAQVRALVQYVRSWNKEPPVTYSNTPIKGNPVHGKALFATHCAACHGANGEGGKGTGVTFSRPRDLPIMPPALNNPGFLASASDAMIKSVLVHGRAGTPMASFLQAGLSESDIDDLVSYVRSFEKQQTPSSASVLTAEKPIIVRESPYDLKTTVENVRNAITTHNFFFGREQPLEYGLTTPDKADPHQVVLYFCNISFLNQALSIDPRVGLFLPCRITVVERHGKVMLMSVNPEVLSKLFNNSELNELCKQMRQNYIAIMEEATL